jgi:hypothetical protein
MTREERWIVSLDEIRAIRWECPQCHLAMSYAMDETVKLPASCPSCHRDLLDTFTRQDDHAYEAFVRALKVIRSQQQRSGAGGLLKLEFLAHPASRPGEGV